MPSAPIFATWNYLTSIRFSTNYMLILVCYKVLIFALSRVLAISTGS